MVHHTTEKGDGNEMKKYKLLKFLLLRVFFFINKHRFQDFA